jgi:hypothetical protein
VLPAILKACSQTASTPSGPLEVAIPSDRAFGSGFLRIVAPIWIVKTCRRPTGIELPAFLLQGIGTDIQWARGRWSAAGEWQCFQFNRPDGSKAVGNYEYGEVKLILTPRLYAAARVGFRRQDFQPSHHTTELAVGFRPNRIQLLKVGYLWMGGEEVEGSEYNVFGIQYVTSSQPSALGLASLKADG